ncbi:ParB/RepB/Spo0J family partition protein [Streptomyces sp. UH6]|uniref:ParB/RepB/Spo0J family partition protein n=1 Tax=Streptomyces sp. UH6 TaxID=2748379 RepID=UPI0015D4B278|nr:ParB/RepB/Spo0J family partition protein [Streptomyces sp. UH6]NYV73928.1 ParB/RepB/Spo0J family partition protein [Streptomyces sp. UH6]
MSGIADRLGTGSSFGKARGRSARGRAKAIVQGDVPAYELVRLRLEEVSPTPLNPRRNFGGDAELTRFGEELRNAQLAACVAVTRDAYLALWPDHKERIGDALHVLVNGERRYRAGSYVGLDALDFVVRDDLASSREQFVNHLLKENLDREDFDVIERARGVEQLVAICAEQSGERDARARAAEQLGRDRSWVTNQLALLELPEELQQMLSSGGLPERDGRALVRHLRENPDMDSAALLEHLQRTKEAAARAKEEERAALAAVREAAANGLLSADNMSASLSADNKPVPTVPHQEPSPVSASESAEPAAEPVTVGAGSLSADNEPSAGTTRQTRPEEPSAFAPVPAPAPAPSPAPISTPGSLSADNKPTAPPAPTVAPATAVEGTTPAAPEVPAASSLPESTQPKRLPYDDAPYVIQHLHRKMEKPVFVQGGRLWMRILQAEHPEEYRSLLADLDLEEKPSA